MGVPESDARVYRPKARRKVVGGGRWTEERELMTKKTLDKPKCKGGKATSVKKDKPGSGLRILSFFTGCGGLDLGFEQAGFQTVYATDIDPDSCSTLRLNTGVHLHPEIQVQEADIFKIDPRSLPKNIDLIIGGPPCQSFSASGRRAGRLDQRGNLFEAYCRIIAAVQPKAFVFENVRGILGTNKGADWNAIVGSFVKLGYMLTYRLLDALDYGVPQQRERMFLVGHQLSKPFLFPEPTHGPDSAKRKPHITAGEAFQGIKEDEDVQSLRLTGGKYSHLLPLVPPGQNYLFFTAKRGYPHPIFAYRSRFSDFLYKANPNTPVKTIIASPGKYTGPLHWENRYFSVREYMRLQGFPDDYKFSGARDDIIRQIGNSVSPYIAYQLALAIAAQIFERPNDVRLLETERVLSFDQRKGVKAQKTRAMHLEIVNSAKRKKISNLFTPSSYTARIEPTETPPGKENVKARVGAHGVSIRIDTDDSGQPFSRMVLQMQQSLDSVDKRLRLTVSAFGRSPATAQAMWNAVDDWVRQASAFHSLFELYGHFTEPHPMFDIEGFEALSDHPVALFAAHAASFENCSRYFPKSHIVKIFSKVLRTQDFNDIASYLRSYRFDIRSRETNIAISPESYMVAYPFNLPARRQMNFRVRTLNEDGLLMPYGELS